MRLRKGSLEVQEFRSSGVLISADLERVFASANGQEFRSLGEKQKESPIETLFLFFLGL